MNNILEPKNSKYTYASIAVICLITFYPVLKADFMGYDDPYYVLENNYIKEISFKNITGIFTGKAIDLYIPATMILYLFEYNFFETNATMFHLTSLLIHIINSILLMKILIRLRIQNQLLIHCILLFFALNPLVCENVCWITGQKDLLYTLFLFLSTLQFILYRDTGSKKKILLSLLYFLLACLSKPMAISLPFLFLIYVYYSDRKLDIKKSLYLIPFFILSILFAFISFYAIKSAAESSIPQYSVVQRVFVLISETGYYFFKPFLPISQQLINPFPENNAVFEHAGILLFAVLGTLLIVVLLHNIFKIKDRLITALFLAWFVFLIPVLQFYPNTHSYVSERYFYVSIIFPPAIVLVYTAKKGLIGKKISGSFYFLLVIFALLSFNRSKYWIDTKTMFTQELKVDANDSRALNNLGYYYNSVNDFASAQKILSKAIALDHNNHVYLNNYGWTLSGLNLTDSAISVFKMALQKKPDFIKSINNLGICYAYKRDWPAAYSNFTKAYDLNKEDPETLYNLGLYYLNTGDKDKSITLMRKSLQLGNKNAAKYTY